MWSVLVGFM